MLASGRLVLKKNPLFIERFEEIIFVALFLRPKTFFGCGNFFYPSSIKVSFLSTHLAFSVFLPTDTHSHTHSHTPMPKHSHTVRHTRTRKTNFIVLAAPSFLLVIATQKVSQISVVRRSSLRRHDVDDDDDVDKKV